MSSTSSRDSDHRIEWMIGASTKEAPIAQTWPWEKVALSIPKQGLPGPDHQLMPQVRTPVLLMALALAGMATPVASAGTSPEGVQEKHLITTASRVRVRATPDLGGRILDVLSVGTVLQVAGRTDRKERVGSMEGYWHRVRTQEGVQGWTFGRYVIPYDEHASIDAYRTLTRIRLGSEDGTLEDYLDLLNFLARVLPSDTSEAAAELELARLHALQAALDRLPFAPWKKPPLHRGWLLPHEHWMGYGEPQGQWFVRPERFWDLHEKYRAFPIADRIAWDAATQPRGGECEDDVQCLFYHTIETMGRYLHHYPRGAHAGEAIEHVLGTLSLVQEYSNGHAPRST